MADLRPDAKAASLPRVEVKHKMATPSDGVLDLDPDTIEPGRHYRWVKDTPQRVARHKMRGYRVVETADGVVPIVPLDDAGDGRFRNADMLLMSCDEDAFQARRANAEELAISRTKTNSVDKDVRKAAKKRGIKTFRRSPDEDDE